MLEIIYHLKLNFRSQWRHCCSVVCILESLGSRNVAVTVCGQHAVSRWRPDIAPAFWTDDLLNYFNNRIVRDDAWSMSDPGDTWLLLCWHWAVTWRVPCLGHVRHVGWVTSGEYHDVIVTRTQRMTRVWRGSDNNQHESSLYRGSGIHNNPGVKEARSVQYSAFQHLEQFAEYH